MGADVLVSTLKTGKGKWKSSEMLGCWFVTDMLQSTFA